MAKEITQIEEVEETTEETKNEARESGFTLEQEKKLIEQIQSEFKLAHDFINPKRKKWLIRLKLYNNQVRDDEAVGDPLMFTVMQTVMASLFDDKLITTYEPREIGDIETAQNWDTIAKYDYKEMDKAKLDYYWIWDTCFFGKLADR